jgi:quinol monooxygenase YgiN
MAPLQDGPPDESVGELVVQVEFVARPGLRPDLDQYLAGLLIDTRGFDGCLGVVVLTSQDVEGGMVVQERWRSEHAYEKYVAWREGRDDLRPLLDLVRDGPTRRRLHPLDL